MEPKKTKCDGCQKEFEQNYWETQTKCQPCRHGEIQEVWWKSICPPLYQESDPARLPRLPEVMKWTYGSRGLILMGKTGAGKTRCAWQLLKREHFANHRITAFDQVSFAHKCVSMFSAVETSGWEDWIEGVQKAPIVFFDDLGKFRFSERVEMELSNIIEFRTSHLLPIIVTTNDDGDSLKARMSENRGEPVVRRLREFCDSIVF
jgi:DNA replication protein DnaC